MRYEISLIICIIGGAVYFIIGAAEPTHPALTKLGELGRLAFLAGLVAFLFAK